MTAPSDFKPRLPTLFVSHGAPTYALAPGIAGPQLTAFAARLPRPAAVLVVSPHWTTSQARVGASARPRTIHDFGGFPRPLYDLQYPAPGAPAFAARAAALLNAAGWQAALDEQRGLDHGAGVPLRYLYPQADVPVFQVSMPSQLDSASAFEFGRALAPLADEGVLIVGSGSLTHNLYEFRSGDGAQPAAYARAFVAWVREAVTRGDHARLLQTLALAPDAARAHPTAEHFLPLLVAAGAAGGTLPVEVLEGGYTHSVLSMESYAFGVTADTSRAPAASAGAMQETAHVQG